ncbi:Copia protein, partial [Mucuna pruriens]
MHDPRERHLQAIEKIIHYLKTSPCKGLLLRREGSLSLEIYTDANYPGLLGGNLVTWRSKKQNVVVRSSAEAEITLDDLKVKYDGPIDDNNSAINIAHNLIQLDRTKHIEIDRHFIKEKLNGGLIVTVHIPKGGIYLYKGASKC